MASKSVGLEIRALESDIECVHAVIAELQEKLDGVSGGSVAGELDQAVASHTSKLARMQQQLTRLISANKEGNGRRTSSRERRTTPKMTEHLAEEESKRERKFFKGYGALKNAVWEARERMKTQCSLEEMQGAMSKVETQHSKLEDLFVEMRKRHMPSQDVREKMDRASAMARDILNALEEASGAIGEPIEERREALRQLLRHDYARSVYGSEVSMASGKTHTESISSERIRWEADIAAKEAEIRKNKVIEVQRQRLKELEDARDLECLRARVDTYRRAENGDEIKGRQDQTLVKHTLDPDAPPWNPVNHTEHQTGVAQPHQEEGRRQEITNADVVALASAIQNSISSSNLPAPEPPVFSGDALAFPRWKMSFKTLIERKSLTTSEKMFYLNRYLSGPALRAVEAYFYDISENSYSKAWKLLEDRYGHHFKLQEAFREKLEHWPKIANPGTGLQEFADFLRSCADATTQVPSLSILNDCKENQRLVLKLPDSVASRWNRRVTERLEESEDYPTFSEFVTFVSKEARIACNPVTSFGALKDATKGARDTMRSTSLRPRTKGTALLSTTDPKPNSASEGKPRPLPAEDGKSATLKHCKFCRRSSHYLPNCPDFEKVPITQRKEFVQKSRLCYGCLRVGHAAKDCRYRHTCRTCKGRHPTVLHEERSGMSPGGSGTSVVADKAVSHRVKVSDAASTSLIVPVWLSSSDANGHPREVLSYAILDNQSDCTFISEDLASRVATSSTPVKLSVKTVTTPHSRPEPSELVRHLVVRGMRSDKTISIPKAYTRKYIPAEKAQIPTPQLASEWPHLSHLSSEIPDLQECGIGLLIGTNCPAACLPREVLARHDHEPYGIRTDLGWGIVKGFSNEDMSGTCHRIHTKELPGATVRDLVAVLQLDFVDQAQGDKSCSQEDLRFIKFLEDHITQQEEGHLSMPLPFRKRPNLPDNRRLAITRLQHLKRKLEGDERLRKHYLSFMQEIIDKGYAERAPEEMPPGETNYIPHHGVMHAKKDKLRVVFDCSAKYAGTSLNDCLMTGPDMVNSLVGVLLRFRKHEVTLLCDVEKMFYQFKVPEEDRDFLRFLWWEDGDTNSQPVDYRMAVHLFGAASSPGCANFGLKFLAERHQSEFPLAAAYLKRDFYVDDGVTSVPTEDQAIKLAEESRSLCERGGLRLHKFVSNSKQVMDSIPETERGGQDVINLQGIEDSPFERALGVMWDPAADAFSFKISLKEQPLTRRGILSTVASLFDPLGFIAPVVLGGKQILQKMCHGGIGWDDPIPQELRPRWEQWVEGLSELERFKVSRCYHPHDFGEPVKVELHSFSDASTEGYGQCSYLRMINRDGKVYCCLVFAKARVAPTKVITIPRLELTAATVSAKVATMLREELNYEDIQEYFWTDSMAVLGYISNEARRFHTFVANRVQLIRENTDPTKWRYVATEENPADWCSRALSPKELLTSSWLQGPRFLWDRDLKSPHKTPELCLGDPEVRKVTVLVTSSTCGFPTVEKIARFSSWSKVVGAVARLQRLARKERSQKPVSCEERKTSEMFLVRSAQAQAFEEDVAKLQKGVQVKSCSKLRQLDPFLDEFGVLRVGGRLAKGQFPDHVKHPAILPKEGPVTKLLIQHVHDRTLHQGRGMTLNELRASGYWILGGSKVVQSYIHKCVICRKCRRPTEEQKMADLPSDRTEPSAPFTFCGMDVFGPFIVKKARKEYKRYGLIITCLYCRGVHIEMLEDMSTDCFINALRTFIAIRGAVRQLRSDQGTNFTGASRELKEALKELDIRRVEVYLADKQCEFLFNAPSASHAGGVWERLIRSIRNILDSTLRLYPGRLDDGSLRTYLYEAMSIVNGRPLSVSNLNDPAQEPLTPNHLIQMKSTQALPPPGRFLKEDMYLTKRWRRVQYLTEVFWGRWQREYLLVLNERQKWCSPRRNVNVGDVVLVKEETSPRMSWPLGRVSETKCDEDGLVRRVKVTMSTRKLNAQGRRDGQLTVLERPIQKLVVLIEA